jgi:F-type H+-transporting ATPase subunit b
MPQLTQLPEIFWSQLFWLVVVFGIIFFVIGRGMVPKIQQTVDQRDAQIAADLAAADAAKAEAEATEEAYRTAMDKSRAEATKLTSTAKADGAKATEKRIAKADVAIQQKVAKAEQGLREATQAARAEIESVAAEIARDIARKVGGIAVSSDDAAKALKATING